MFAVVNGSSVVWSATHPILIGDDQTDPSKPSLNFPSRLR